MEQNSGGCLNFDVRNKTGIQNSKIWKRKILEAFMISTDNFSGFEKVTNSQRRDGATHCAAQGGKSTDKSQMVVQI